MMGTKQAWRFFVAALLLRTNIGGGEQQQQQQQLVCRMADALYKSVDAHLEDWDNQILIGLNESFNCSTFLEFVYLSRDRIRTQLEYIRGNFTADHEELQARGEAQASATWAMSHMSSAASLVSAHLHIHGTLIAARRECLSQHLQLLFLMSLRRLKALLQGQLQQLWDVFQGSPDRFSLGAGRWLAGVVELLDADLKTMASIMVSWQPPPDEEPLGGEDDGTGGGAAPPAPYDPAIGPPLPPFKAREPDGVALSTIEVIRRDAFGAWATPRPVLRALLRHVLPRDTHVLDMCAGSGAAAQFLNDTGLLSAYAFDASPNIQLLSKGAVGRARLHDGQLELWRKFDVLLCLTAAEDYKENAEAWNHVWRNVERTTMLGAVVSCGTGTVRQQAIAAAARFAPSFEENVQLEQAVEAAVEAPGTSGVCVFWRRSFE